MDFMNQLKNNMDNVSVTENNAVGYQTTGKYLLDLNFAVASLRGAPETTIFDKWMGAYIENPTLALKWLFFARDVREGLGERRLFRVITKELANNGTGIIKHLIPHIAKYGRWDDVVSLLETGCQGIIVELIRLQLAADITEERHGRPISLLAKWLPSTNASSKETRRIAKKLCNRLNMSEPVYRKTLSRLRRYIDVVEKKMSSNLWGTIDYTTVPSRANLIYRHAFMRHDSERRLDFLNKVESGEVKINSSVNFPHDIVHRYSNGPHDRTLEELWKALPDTVQGNTTTIVVADGSGSMRTPVGGGNCTALSVANALAIYFAERSRGQFHNKYITFSSHPQMVDLSQGQSLREKLLIAKGHCEISNTNIEAVFDLILNTAVQGRMTQSDIPNVLIISDMEFDGATHGGGGFEGPSQRLFESIRRKYMVRGYTLPKLIFWNVNSRTGTIPVIENELGVALVSGFSVNIAKMVMSGNMDPYELLVENLMSPRYEEIQ